MGKVVIDKNSNAQLAIMADICDYAYVNPSEMPEDRKLRYLDGDSYTDSSGVIKHRGVVRERFYKHGHNFSAIVVELKPNCIVIAFRGTHRLWSDIDADIKMFFKNKLPFWAKNEGGGILGYVQSVLDAYPNYQVIFAGHSLAGVLAKLCALKFYRQAVTFNSFSILELQEKYFKDRNDYSLLLNIRVNGDVVSEDVNLDCSKGATLREINIDMELKDFLIPGHRQINVHLIENIREVFDHKAKKALGKIGMDKMRFWEVFSKTSADMLTPADFISQSQDYQKRLDKNSPEVQKAFDEVMRSYKYG